MAKVYIVGCGPGDAGLITVKGLAALRKADCVVYDRLAAKSLLTEVPRSAQLVDAGKRPGAHSIPQAEINRLLVEKARQGLAVVRLKGGDPLLFGRGAEEADALAEAGVEFEIIPGVTAALGAASYAGIPLTDRRECSCVTFVTGREGDGGSPGVNWRAVAETRGTIVVYMGRSELAGVTQSLAEAGLPGSTPAAVVENATLPSERVITGTLATIAARADEAAVEPPCVTVIGAVAAKYPSLAWHERLPLFGKSVCLTRADYAQSDLARALEAMGAEVIRFSTIEIVPAPDEKLAVGLAALADADWVVFTSIHGVETFLGALARAGRDCRSLAGKRVAAIGPSTAQALLAGGIRADLVPRTFTGGALLDELVAASEKGEKFLLWRAALAREELADGLRREGRAVVEVVAYEAVRASLVDAAVRDRLISAPPSAVLFASASAVKNFADIVGAAETLRLCEVCKFISIGPVTSAALRELGALLHAEASVHTGQGLLETTVEALKAKPGQR